MRHEKLEGLLTEHAVKIYKYSIKMGASKEDAEDIVQDAVCKAVQYVDAIDAGKVSAWLFKFSIRNYYNLYRRNKRVVIEFNEQTLAHLHSDETLETSVLNAELKQNVQHVLETMTDSYKNLMILRYFLDLSYKEIALALDLDESNVKTYLFRARNQFRALWKELRYDH